MKQLLAVVLILSLIAISVAQIPQGIPLNLQMKLKRKGQSCMKRHLPADPTSIKLQQQLAVCFDPNCGNRIIQQVTQYYPQYYPQLRQCFGY